MITMLHLLLFILLSIFLILFPCIFGVNKKGGYPLLQLKLPKKVNFLELQKYIARILVQGLNMFKDLVQSDFRVLFLWTQSVILWISSCYSWILHAEIVYTIFAYISILFCVLAIFVRSLMIKTEF